jgi:hypothetical protein
MLKGGEYVFVQKLQLTKISQPHTILPKLNKAVKISNTIILVMKWKLL